jgi:mRNA interferase HigB
MIDYSPILGLIYCMRVISLKILKDFYTSHPAAEQPLKAWLNEAQQAKWAEPAQIKSQYSNASILKSRRVVFNIKGNNYRLVVAIAYQYGAVYIKFVGTHIEYDKIDANSVEME